MSDRTSPETTPFLPDSAALTEQLRSSPRAARWIVPALAAAFRGTETSTLEPATRALLLLRIAAVERSPYWRIQWESAARGVGVPDRLVSLVGIDEWEMTHEFEPRERAAITWGDRVARRLAQRDAAAYQQLRDEFSSDEIVELTLISALAAMAVRMTNALRIEPDGPIGLAPSATPVDDAQLASWIRATFDTTTSGVGA